MLNVLWGCYGMATKLNRPRFIWSKNKATKGDKKSAPVKGRGQPNVFTTELNPY